MAIGLNKIFKLSGSSDLPAYPGLNVINKPIIFFKNKLKFYLILGKFKI